MEGIGADARHARTDHQLLHAAFVDEGGAGELGFAVDILSGIVPHCPAAGNGQCPLLVQRPAQLVAADAGKGRAPRVGAGGRREQRQAQEQA